MAVMPRVRSIARVPREELGLVPDHRGRARAGPTGLEPGDGELSPQRGEHRGVPDLAYGEGDDQRAAASIDELVNLNGQASAEAADCVIGGSTHGFL